MKRPSRPPPPNPPRGRDPLTDDDSIDAEALADELGGSYGSSELPPSPSELLPGDPDLDEIDRIIEEVRTRRNGEVPGETDVSPTGPAPWGEGPSGKETFPEPRGAPGGFFEEHLIAARRAVGTIDEEIEQLEATSTGLRKRVAAAESELDRITQEYMFARQQDWREGSGGENRRSLPPWSEADLGDEAHLKVAPTEGGTYGVPWVVPTDAPPFSPPVYQGFTVDRYNRTIDSLKGRRDRLVVLTLLLSAVIGVLLVSLVLFSPVVNPPIWIAALPLVWIIPIPYFLLSFRGAQRVVQRNHLNLPEAR